MASLPVRNALGPLLRRSALSTRASASSLRGGSGMSPPVPPFARNLPATEKLVEEHDLVWDDGVAPELTIDFDCQHISKGEGLAWWLGGLGFFASLYGLVSLTDPAGKNPAVNREMNMVVESPKTGKPTPDEA